MMDDYGTDYRMYMSTPSCRRWYISASAYGGFEDWDGYIAHVL